MAEDMILIDVALTTTEANRGALVSLLGQTVAGSEAEPGCATYRATVALDDPLKFHILELWESESAYLAHCKGAPLARFLEQLPGCGTIVSINRRTGPFQPYEKKA
ncbi:putative quinol monooxygenase [Sphingobium baderi]|uniref:ABM domain-containing protein n=1 Tax=Sphingobium baderi TaxID=1332080 RepID=A0A0S3F298_9SPHN|nr:antibiotic biosynthesis monooxygenase [Sphingobium baderi]ALR21845.1 hypothetical protein ATN00_17640 [Sphingobium baderi]